jgi:hypothetical protein
VFAVYGITIPGKLPICLIDCLQQATKTWSVLDWPGPIERRTEPLQFGLSQQRQRDNPIRHEVS